ncbi:hypothetical protein FOA43_004656 [Brettanomyces nanus]|uniref:DUF7082 domain-containing protein n=1 Tax=Eeniella nana TaxID=13502 RepID=A0A875SCT0_EENNA|nr:uncharacterized protein FOA43_004656 [Brettanomyces nanus]QPG77249.1 hypothetical protein FOA43_004656 [Brettanomyces nanus]
MHSGPDLGLNSDDLSFPFSDYIDVTSTDGSLQDDRLEALLELSPFLDFPTAFTGVNDKNYFPISSFSSNYLMTRPNNHDMFPPAEACSPSPKLSELASSIYSKSASTHTPESTISPTTLSVSTSSQYPTQDYIHGPPQKSFQDPIQYPFETFIRDSTPDSIQSSLQTLVDLESLKRSNSDPGPEELPNSVQVKYISPYSLVRGFNVGKCGTKPPEEIPHDDLYKFVTCELDVSGASYDCICEPSWSSKESEEMRRIVRIQRIQTKNIVFADFSIVDTSAENSRSDPPENNRNDLLEVSCVRCECADGDEGINGSGFRYYITSVEVIKIVELLVHNTVNQSAKERRRERGRIRSNLAQLWWKDSINRKKWNNTTNHSGRKSENDCKVELAQRIMGYKTRKPRIFNKDVRILDWRSLVPALHRAMQCYHVKVPKVTTPNL